VAGGRSEHGALLAPLPRAWGDLIFGRVTQAKPPPENSVRFKSACTLFLGIRNVCVERSATLMFHAGYDIAQNVTGPNTRASRAALYRYSDALRRYLLEGHYLDTDLYHSVPGSAIIDRFGYRECPPQQ
jgi:hypothetical protein